MNIFELRKGDLLVYQTAARREDGVEFPRRVLLVLSVERASQYDDDLDIVWWNLTDNKREADRNSRNEPLSIYWKVFRDGEEIVS